MQESELKLKPLATSKPPIVTQKTLPCIERTKKEEKPSMAIMPPVVIKSKTIRTQKRPECQQQRETFHKLLNEPLVLKPERLSALTKPKPKQDVLPQQKITKVISTPVLALPAKQAKKQQPVQIVARPSLLKQKQHVKTTTDFFKPEVNETLEIADKLPSIKRVSKTAASIRVSQQASDKKQEDRDWLLDPSYLYLRGMAQKREMMRALQPQIQQAQR